jgi:hypothetical protein
VACRGFDVPQVGESSAVEMGGKLCVVSSTLFCIDVPRWFDLGGRIVHEGTKWSEIIPRLFGYDEHSL